MKYYKFIIFLLLLICFSCMFSIYLSKNIKESFTNDIDYYVISMMNKDDRIKNIENQTKKIDKQIEIVQAVIGKDLDLEYLIKKNKLSPNADLYKNEKKTEDEITEIHKRECGCYLSHLKVYDTILKKGKTGYSIILEDDFNFNPDFLKKLEDTIDTIEKNNIDFDLLFLGLSGGIGEQVADNIYKIGNDINNGTYGYLVNNKNIKKIKNSMNLINSTVDADIFNKGRRNEMTVYCLKETIIGHLFYGTEIR